MPINRWKEISTKFFKKAKDYDYNNGKLSNYLQKRIYENSICENQINYCRFINGELYAVIVKTTHNTTSFIQNNNYVYLSFIKDKGGFSYRTMYGNSLDDLKLKADLYLIEQKHKITFPGV